MRWKLFQHEETNAEQSSASVKAGVGSGGFFVVWLMICFFKIPFTRGASFGRHLRSGDIHSHIKRSRQSHQNRNIRTYLITCILAKPRLAFASKNTSLSPTEYVCSSVLRRLRKPTVSWQEFPDSSGKTVWSGMTRIQCYERSSSFLSHHA